MTDKHTHTHTDRHTNTRTSRLIESIGLRADALKRKKKSNKNLALEIEEHGRHGTRGSGSSTSGVSMGGTLSVDGCKFHAQNCMDGWTYFYRI